MAPPVPDDGRSAPPTAAREGQEAPRELPPYPVLDSSHRLRTTLIVLIVLAAAILVALALAWF
jgi:hypothetical protein